MRENDPNMDKRRGYCCLRIRRLDHTVSCGLGLKQKDWRNAGCLVL